MCNTVEEGGKQYADVLESVPIELSTASKQVVVETDRFGMDVFMTITNSEVVPPPIMETIFAGNEAKEWNSMMPDEQQDEERDEEYETDSAAVLS